MQASPFRKLLFLFFFFSAPKYTATMNYVTPGSLKFPLTLFIQVGIALSRSSLCPGASLQPPSTTSNPEWITPSPCTLSLAVGTVQPAVGQFPSIIKQVQTSCLGWHRVIYEDGYHSILPRYFLHCEINWFSFSVEWCWEANPASRVLLNKCSHWTTPSILIYFLNTTKACG